MKPTVGRIVHWCEGMDPCDDRYDPAKVKVVRAAVVTAVDGDYVSLSVFEPNRPTMRVLAGVLFSEEPKPGHWTWPPRV